MSVKKEANGRRSVQVEVEVPGTPEQVWQAIATGPGVGAWFVPTEVDGRVGGTVTSHFGGGMDAVPCGWSVGAWGWAGSALGALVCSALAFCGALVSFGIG